MEPIRNAVSIELAEQTQLAAARRLTREMAVRLDLSPELTARAELVVMELGRNLLQHAGHGRLYLCSTVGGGGLRLIATDTGPGIRDTAAALVDGFSTSTTLGLGLGAVQRLAETFDVYSQVGQGTVISAVLGEDAAGSTAECAVLSTPIAGETLNGDSWMVFSSAGDTPARIVYLLVDGLGHGLYASEAADTAREIAAYSFAQDADVRLDDLLNQMHGPMRATRGAAIAMVSVDEESAVCCGVGNISCSLHGADGSDRSMVSHNGTLGHQMRKVQAFRYPCAAGSLLLMHSDGIATRWRLSGYPGLAARAAGTIAGVLYRDSVRGRDDATMLVARPCKGGPHA